MRQRTPRLDRATGMRSIKWTSQATDGHCNKSVDRLHSNAVRRPKQNRRHNPLAKHYPLGRLQQQSLNGQICIAAITQRPLQRRPQFIETRSFTCQWTKQTKSFASSMPQIIHPQTGGWWIRLIVPHIWSAPHTQRVAQFPSECLMNGQLLLADFQSLRLFQQISARYGPPTIRPLRAIKKRATDH